MLPHIIDKYVFTHLDNFTKMEIQIMQVKFFLLSGLSFSI